MNEEVDGEGEEKKACGWKDIVRVCAGVIALVRGTCFGSVR